MRLLNAGVWFLYPWLIMELALPSTWKTALQPLLLRIIVYLHAGREGPGYSTGGLMALIVTQAANMIASFCAIL